MRTGLLVGVDVLVTFKTKVGIELNMIVILHELWEVLMVFVLSLLELPFDVYNLALVMAGFLTAEIY